MKHSMKNSMRNSMKKSIKSTMKKVIQGTLLTAISFPAFSAGVWEFSLKVSSVINSLDGTVQVLSLKNGATWEPCGTTHWYSFDVTQPGGPAMHSTLLTGLATGKSISLIYDCDNHSIAAVKIDT